MPTPFPSRQAAPTSWSGAATTKPTTSDSEWRCTRCDKLLGVCRDGRAAVQPNQQGCRIPERCE
jgi:hypothetical protein